MHDSIAFLLIIALGFYVVLRLYPMKAMQATLSVARRASGLRRRDIEIEGFRIACLEGGSGTPLVLLHGMGADKDNFLLVARILVRHYHVIVPDLPGFGESDKPADASYRIHDQLKRLDQIRLAFQLDRIHLGGNSMGGLIAGAYAATYPQHVESLWLLAPAGVKAAQPSELMTAIAGGSPLPIFARSVEDLKRLMAFVMHRPTYLPHFALVSMAEQQRAGYELNQRIVSEMVEGPWLDELLADRPRVPTLIVWGDRDRALDVSGAKILNDLLPVSRVRILRDVGHVPMIEMPRQSAQDYLAFRKCLEVDPNWDDSWGVSK